MVLVVVITSVGIMNVIIVTLLCCKTSSGIFCVATSMGDMGIWGVAGYITTEEVVS